MNDPRMTKLQQENMNKNQMDDKKLESENAEFFHPWGEETIVVNGQPMTVTFPPEED